MVVRKKTTSAKTMTPHKSDSAKNPNYIQTTIIDDVFTDVAPMVKSGSEVDYDEYLDQLLRKANPDIYNILTKAKTLKAARKALYLYLMESECRIFEMDNDLHILEKATVRESIHAFRSIIGPVNEHRTGTSALNCLWKLVNNKITDLKVQLSVGFVIEFIKYLFRFQRSQERYPGFLET